MISEIFVPVQVTFMLIVSHHFYSPSRKTLDYVKKKKVVIIESKRENGEKNDEPSE